METQSLIFFLNQINDTRKAKGKRHEQLTIIIIIIIAIMCGKTTLKSISRFAKTHTLELAKHMPLPRNKAPSYSTIQRTVHRLNPNEICESFNNWMAQYLIPEPIAADGKSISSTVKNANNNEQTFASMEADSNMKEKWSGLERYITVQRTGIRDGKEFNVTTNYISSAKQSAWCFANEIRGHRKIENSLHWTKDVVQNEDNCGLSETKNVSKFLYVNIY